MTKRKGPSAAEARAVKAIPVASISEPTRPARKSIDDEGLRELAESMRSMGLLQPIRVRPVDGGGYEVVVGHRRLLAARLLGWASMLATVLDADASPHGDRIHENVFRRELSAADEALYYAELFEELGEDTDNVAEAVGRTREHVEGRLILLQGEPAVFEALQAGKIQIGQATELNKMVGGDNRRLYLQHLIRGGATVAMVRSWRQQVNAKAELDAVTPPFHPASSSDDGEAQGEPPAQPSVFAVATPQMISGRADVRICFMCQRDFPEFRGVVIYICGPCAEQEIEPVLRHRQGQAKPP